LVRRFFGIECGAIREPLMKCAAAYEVPPSAKKSATSPIRWRRT
jgi:hypothetical protein